MMIFRFLLYKYLKCINFLKIHSLKKNVCYGFFDEILITTTKRRKQNTTKENNEKI